MLTERLRERYKDSPSYRSLPSNMHSLFQYQHTPPVWFICYHWWLCFGIDLITWSLQYTESALLPSRSLCQGAVTHLSGTGQVEWAGIGYVLSKPQQVRMWSQDLLKADLARAEWTRVTSLLHDKSTGIHCENLADFLKVKVTWKCAPLPHYWVSRDFILKYISKRLSSNWSIVSWVFLSLRTGF